MKIIAIIYQYYLYKKLPTPYFRTLMTIIGFIILISTICLIVLSANSLNPFSISDKQIINYVYGGIVVAVLYMILFLLIKKSDLEQFNFNLKQIKRAGILIFLVFGLLLLLIITAAVIYSKGES